MPLEFNVSCTKKVCVLQKKVLSFGPNHTIEVWPNSSVKLNVRSVTSLMIHVNLPIEARRCFSWFGFFRSAKQAKNIFKGVDFLCTLPVKMFGPFWSVWCKTALEEVGVSLPWWCPALVLLTPGYWSLFLSLQIFS